MKFHVPDYMESMVMSTRDAFCDLLHEPSLWSDSMIKKTLERGGAKPFNIEDVRAIVKDYLTVLSETLRKGETI